MTQPRNEDPEYMLKLAVFVLACSVVVSLLGNAVYGGLVGVSAAGLIVRSIQLLRIEREQTAR